MTLFVLAFSQPLVNFVEFFRFIYYRLSRLTILFRPTRLHLLKNSVFFQCTFSPCFVFLNSNFFLLVGFDFCLAFIRLQLFIFSFHFVKLKILNIWKLIFQLGLVFLTGLVYLVCLSRRQILAYKWLLIDYIDNLFSILFINAQPNLWSIANIEVIPLFIPSRLIIMFVELSLLFGSSYYFMFVLLLVVGTLLSIPRRL